MFKKVLIANRGEIALRVIRACRELGIETVAVYSEADRESLHVRFADDDVCIGPPPSRQSYLRIPSIIAAAEITGADAIHPGLRLPGGERRVRRDLPGQQHHLHRPHRRPDPPDGRQGHRPAAGPGGGRARPCPARPARSRTPTRRWRSRRRSASRSSSRRPPAGAGRGCGSRTTPEQFTQLFGLAQNEALAAFGNGVGVRREVPDQPRHVEIQVMGDCTGSVVHLGERDCSVQRRHQKLIEESPEPGAHPDAARAGWARRPSRWPPTSATSAPAPSSSCSTPTAASTSWR